MYENKKKQNRLQGTALPFPILPRRVPIPSRHQILTWFPLLLVRCWRTDSQHDSNSHLRVGSKNLITAQIPTVNCCLLWLRCTQEGVGSKNSDRRVRHRATRVCCTLTTCPLRCPTQSLLAYSVRHYPVQRTEKTETTYHLPLTRTYYVPNPYAYYVPTPTRCTYLTHT